MAKCENCGASLEGLEINCPYCGTRNRLKLDEISSYTTVEPLSERNCPECSKPMATIDVGDGGHFYIEHCNDCGGLFFDSGELQELLDSKIKETNILNYSALNSLLVDNPTYNDVVIYRKCPVCSDLMTRENFGAKSGVIIDHCHNHGIWLNSGELNRLLEWKKAGGEIHDSRIKAVKAEQAAKDAERKYRDMVAQSSSDISFSAGLYSKKHFTKGSLLADLIKFLF